VPAVERQDGGKADRVRRRVELLSDGIDAVPGVLARRLLQRGGALNGPRLEVVKRHHVAGAQNSHRPFAVEEDERAVVDPLDHHAHPRVDVERVVAREADLRLADGCAVGGAV